MAVTLSGCSGGSSATQTTTPVSSQTSTQSTVATSTAPSSTAASNAPLGVDPTAGSTSTAPSKTPKPAGLQIKDTKVGKGVAAKAGDTVTVDYTGWLMDGTKFDSSVDRNQPFQFTLGNGDVIKGWDLGVVGMKVGGTRQLIIPPSLAYGEEGVTGTIPVNATLKFQVKLLAIQPTP
jgi:FKBP-type peptidyl-prolyl cis-trans isomerase FkpA